MNKIRYLLISLLFISLFQNVSVQGYQTSGAIFIDDSSIDFNWATLKPLNGWTGAGTANDPIILSGYTFNNTVSVGITIENSDLFINITGNQFNGASTGIFLSNANNVFINNNEFIDNVKGIQLTLSNNTNIVNNLFSFSNTITMGIFANMGNSNTTISENRFLDANQAIIISGSSSDNMTISKNNILSSGSSTDGIYISAGTNITIKDNIVDGILIGIATGSGATNISISDNFLYNNSKYGLQVFGENVTASGNLVEGSPTGIYASSILGTNYLVDNIVENGINIDNNVIAKNNNLKKIGFFIQSYSEVTDLQDGNTLDGYPIVFRNQKDNEVLHGASNQFGQLIILNSTNLEVHHYNFENEKSSMFIQDSEYLTISDISIVGTSFPDSLEIRESTNVTLSKFDLNNQFLRIFASQNITLSESSIIGPGIGIQVDKSNYTQIINNTIDSDFTGIDVYSSLGVDIISNDIRNYVGVTATSLDIRYSSLVKIRDNNFHDLVSVFNVDNLMIDRNELLGEEIGASLILVQNVIFSDNVIVDARSYGLSIFDGTDISVTGNDFIGNGFRDPIGDKIQASLSGVNIIASNNSFDNLAGSSYTFAGDGVIDQSPRQTPHEIIGFINIKVELDPVNSVFTIIWDSASSNFGIDIEYVIEVKNAGQWSFAYRSDDGSTSYTVSTGFFGQIVEYRVIAAANYYSSILTTGEIILNNPATETTPLTTTPNESVISSPDTSPEPQDNPLPINIISFFIGIVTIVILKRTRLN